MRYLLLATVLLGSATTTGAAQGSGGWFFGAEAGVAQYDSQKLNGPSGALRFGRILDRRGILRAGLMLSLAGISQSLVGVAAAGVELRPLSPRRVTPLIGAGAGLLRDIEYQGGNHGLGYVNAGVAVRVAGSVGVTLRGQYAESYKRGGFYTLHLGVEVGR